MAPEETSLGPTQGRCSDSVNIDALHTAPPDAEASVARGMESNFHRMSNAASGRTPIAISKFSRTPTGIGTPAAPKRLVHFHTCWNVPDHCLPTSQVVVRILP